MSILRDLEPGDAAFDAMVYGNPVRVVGYRKTLKGPIGDEVARFAVFVEQYGDYRLGTVRADAVEAVPTPDVECECGGAFGAHWAGCPAGRSS